MQSGKHKGTSIIMAVCGILLAVSVLLGTVDFLASTPGYYAHEFSKNSAIKRIEAGGIQLDNYEMTALANGISGYLSGKYPDFSVPMKRSMAPFGSSRTVIGSTVHDAFNEREKSHMADVLSLFEAGRILMRVALLICAILAAFYARAFKSELIHTVLTMLKSSIVCTGIISMVLLVSGRLDFSYYFIKFHEAFFSNDLWLLDPSSSLLINLLPESFFVDFVTNAILTGAGVLIMTFLAVRTVFFIKYVRGKERCN